MRISPFKAVMPDRYFIADPSSFVAEAKVNFKDLYNKEYFERADKESIYIYQITEHGHQYNGLVAQVNVEEYTSQLIRPHEKTLKAKEQISMQLMVQREAIIKPVLATYPSNKEIANLIKQVIKKNKPIQSINFRNKNSTHTFWAVNDAVISKKLIALFAKEVKTAYIADGHHRIQVFSRLLGAKKKQKRSIQSDQVLTALFDFDSMKVWDYNRLISLENNMTAVTFLARLSAIADIKPLKTAQKTGEKFKLTFCINQEWFALKWKSKILDKEKRQFLLDHEIFDKYVLQRIMGIKDIQTDSHVNYFAGDKPFSYIEDKLHSDPHLVAFYLFPVSMEEIKKVADKGNTLPPKSTYFVPRLINGMIADDIGTKK